MAVFINNLNYYLEMEVVLDKFMGKSLITCTPLTLVSLVWANKRALISNTVSGF